MVASCAKAEERDAKGMASKKKDKAHLGPVGYSFTYNFILYLLNREQFHYKLTICVS